MDSKIPLQTFQIASFFYSYFVDAIWCLFSGVWLSSLIQTEFQWHHFNLILCITRRLPILSTEFRPKFGFNELIVISDAASVASWLLLSHLCNQLAKQSIIIQTDAKQNVTFTFHATYTPRKYIYADTISAERKVVNWADAKQKQKQHWNMVKW